MVLGLCRCRLADSLPAAVYKTISFGSAQSPARGTELQVQFESGLEICNNVRRVNKVAQVQHEIEPLEIGRSLVFENHSTIGILRALIYVLTAHERKSNRPCIVGRGSGNIRYRIARSHAAARRYQLASAQL